MGGGGGGGGDGAGCGAGVLHPLAASPSRRMPSEASRRVMVTVPSRVTFTVGLLWRDHKDKRSLRRHAPRLDTVGVFHRRSHVVIELKLDCFAALAKTG
jgi:hypothetical protein